MRTPQLKNYAWAIIAVLIVGIIVASQFLISAPAELQKGAACWTLNGKQYCIIKKRPATCDANSCAIR